MKLQKAKQTAKVITNAYFANIKNADQVKADDWWTSIDNEWDINILIEFFDDLHVLDLGENKVSFLSTVREKINVTLYKVNNMEVDWNIPHIIYDCKTLKEINADKWWNNNS